MEKKKKKKHPITRYNIYSLGLAPAILLWVLSPILDKTTVVIASIVVGIIGIKLASFFTRLHKGCGIIGWVTSWSLLLGGVLWGVLFLLKKPYIPMILLEAPCIALLFWLLQKRYIRPSFCDQCLRQRGGLRERQLLGDYSRYETYYIARLTRIGAELVSVLVWVLFLWGTDIQSRTGRYFYFYFPAALGMAIILFETARRWIILQIIDSHEKKREHQNRRDTPDQPTHTIKNTSVVRIIVIGQEKMYLIENPGNKNEPISGSGLDVPLHHHIEYCTTQKEEGQIARQIVRQELHIADPDLPVKARQGREQDVPVDRLPLDEGHRFLSNVRRRKSPGSRLGAFPSRAGQHSNRPARPAANLCPPLCAAHLSEIFCGSVQPHFRPSAHISLPYMV